MVTVSDPVAFEQKNCVSCGRGLVGRVQKIHIAQLELPAFDQRRSLFHRGANAVPLRGFLRQQVGLQRVEILGHDSVATRPAAADSASRSSEPSSACAVQLVAQLASGASNKTEAARTINPMRIPANILSAQ